MLKKRFQIIQKVVKQAEINIFNTMNIKSDETTGNFMDTLVKLAEKLEGLGTSQLKKD